MSIFIVLSRKTGLSRNYFSDKQNINIVLTTGGTGPGPRDITPEATASVCERMAPGFSEIIRVECFGKTSKSILSRGVSGIRKNTLIINLPGSPKAVRECLEIILCASPVHQRPKKR